MNHPNPDYWEAHEEEETYVASAIYGQPAHKLVDKGFYIVSDHARKVPASATFQALIWDTTTIWQTRTGELIHHTQEAPPLEAVA